MIRVVWGNHIKLGCNFYSLSQKLQYTEVFQIGSIVVLETFSLDCV